MSDGISVLLIIPARPGIPGFIGERGTTPGHSSGEIRNVTNAMEFRLLPAGAWTAVTTAPDVTGLAAGAYQVRYRAVAGVSFASNAVNLNINETAPHPPVNLTATPGDGYVVLTWEAPNPGFPSFEYFSISYGPTATYTQNWWWAGGSATLTHTITGLTNGVNYTFEVRAQNAQGSSISSGTVTATPSAPGAAVNFTGVTADGASGVTTTSALTLHFDTSPTGLALGNISISGGITAANL